MVACDDIDVVDRCSCNRILIMQVSNKGRCIAAMWRNAETRASACIRFSRSKGSSISKYKQRPLEILPAAPHGMEISRSCRFIWVRTSSNSTLLIANHSEETG